MAEARQHIPWLFGTEISEEEWLLLLNSNLEIGVDQDVRHSDPIQHPNPNGDGLYSNPDGVL